MVHLRWCDSDYHEKHGEAEGALKLLSNALTGEVKYCLTFPLRGFQFTCSETSEDAWEGSDWPSPFFAKSLCFNSSSSL